MARACPLAVLREAVRTVPADRRLAGLVTRDALRIRHYVPRTVDVATVGIMAGSCGHDRRGEAAPESERDDYAHQPQSFQLAHFPLAFR